VCGAIRSKIKVIPNRCSGCNKVTRTCNIFTLIRWCAGSDIDIIAKPQLSYLSTGALIALQTGCCDAERERNTHKVRARGARGLCIQPGQTPEQQQQQSRHPLYLFACESTHKAILLSRTIRLRNTQRVLCSKLKLNLSELGREKSVPSDLI
jgi:hypothetical protein